MPALSTLGAISTNNYNFADYLFTNSVTIFASRRYGDLYPTNETELFFNIIFMAGGTMFFGFVGASLAANLANADAACYRFKEKIDGIFQFFHVFPPVNLLKKCE